MGELKRKRPPPPWHDILELHGDESYYTVGQIERILNAPGIPLLDDPVSVLRVHPSGREYTNLIDRRAALAEAVNNAALWWATAAAAEASKGRRPRADDIRRHYVTAFLVKIYEKHFGQSARANATKKGVQGPFFRFVQAAMEPLNHKITGDALRDLLRKKKPSKGNSTRRGPIST